MIKRSLVSLLAIAMILSISCTTAFAAETVPEIEEKDFTNEGIPTYTYEGDYAIQSFETTDEELEYAASLQKPHTHPSMSRHAHITVHKHSICDIKNKADVLCKWRPTPMWTKNNTHPNSIDWPTLSWSVGTSITVSANVSTSVGVTDSIVSASLGSGYTKSHTISTSITQTFKIPYKKEGRILVEYNRPSKTFTCKTVYYLPSGNTVTETGSGSALGAPRNIVCSLETRSI